MRGTEKIGADKFGVAIGILETTFSLDNRVGRNAAVQDTGIPREAFSFRRTGASIRFEIKKKGASAAQNGNVNKEKELNFHRLAVDYNVEKSPPFLGISLG